MPLLRRRFLAFFAGVVVIALIALAQLDISRKTHDSANADQVIHFLLAAATVSIPQSLYSPVVVFSSLAINDSPPEDPSPYVTVCLLIPFALLWVMLWFSGRTSWFTRILVGVQILLAGARGCVLLARGLTWVLTGFLTTCERTMAWSGAWGCGETVCA
ncbi:unnamed protein product [Zymoseptoria tritici ST99CH_1A5]|uniref:Uncharacterized protein n=1 Tax=Zymoseptoria tritici ST99CH_1A5 TaxID=1276529 RepID=A0A1Y6M5J2_ZYMTR|nr:unnamed protein product [Zymoseptoria tritici ST99CH_3D1]SMY30371.1 unnamed protein product [Zymoseptoria tritici ST99CH_1A5]